MLGGGGSSIKNTNDLGYLEGILTGHYFFSKFFFLQIAMGTDVIRPVCQFLYLLGFEHSIVSGNFGKFFFFHWRVFIIYTGGLLNILALTWTDLCNILQCVFPFVFVYVVFRYYISLPAFYHRVFRDSFLLLVQAFALTVCVKKY